jgi:enoyl-CoA hydratase/carnithine racemase
LPAGTLDHHVGGEVVASSDRVIAIELATDHIHLRLNRPPVNAFTVEMFRELTERISNVADDPRCLLLSGGDEIFSAGFDIKTPSSDSAGANKAALDCLRAFSAHPGPTVAAVEHAAVGVGLLLAMSADFLVIAKNAFLMMPEITMGMNAEVGPLRRYVTEPWIRRLCLLGEGFTAEDLGLESRGAVLSEPRTSRASALALVQKLAALDPISVRNMKRHFT